MISDTISFLLARSAADAQQKVEKAKAIGERDKLRVEIFGEAIDRALEEQVIPVMIEMRGKFLEHGYQAEVLTLLGPPMQGAEFRFLQGDAIHSLGYRGFADLGVIVVEQRLDGKYSKERREATSLVLSADVEERLERFVRELLENLR